MTTSPKTVEPSYDEAAHPPVRRVEAWTIAAITAAFLSLVALWTVLAPIYDAPDEVIHLNSAVRLTSGWDWPAPGDAQMLSAVEAAMGQQSLPADQRSTFTELAESHPGYRGVDQMTQHPPLYYAYTAAVLNTMDFMDVRNDLVLLSVRLSGLIFALPMPALVWASVRRITRSPKAAIVGAASLFAVPQLAHILGAVSNDGMTVMFSSIVIWLAIRIMTGDARWRTVVAIGVALALALFSKGTALPLVPFVILTLAIWPRGLSLGGRLGRFAVAGGISFLGGLWWIRNLLVFGTLLPNAGRLASTTWPEGSGPDILYLTNRVWNGLTSSFWGHFGWLSHPMPTFITASLTVISAAVIIFYAFRPSPIRGRLMAIAALPLVVIVVFLVQRWQDYARTGLTPGIQGRYFFPLLVSFITLSAVAWMNLVPRLERRATASFLLGGFVFVAMLGVVVEYAAVYDGLGWFRYSPIGTVGSLGVLALTAATGAMAFAMAWRFVREAAPSVPEITPRPRD